MANITVIGSINMDLVVRTTQIPIPGETVLGQDFGTFPGGKGANQAVAAARQGASVTMIGRVGSDAFGEELVTGLQNEEIDTRLIAVDETVASGVAFITLDAAGQNSIIVAPGANHKLKPEHITDFKPAFHNADILLLQLEIPLETVITAAQLAKKNGIRVVLNPAPAQGLPHELLKHIDILIPNESETGILTGMPVDTLEQIKVAAQKLLALGVGCVIVTLGKHGALLVQKSELTRHIPSYSVNVVDTTAAGDSFVGALAVSLAAGQPLETAVQRGCAAGALATTRLGAQPSIPYKAEIDQLVTDCN